MDDLTGLVLLALGWLAGRFLILKPKKAAVLDNQGRSPDKGEA